MARIDSCVQDGDNCRTARRDAAVDLVPSDSRQAPLAAVIRVRRRRSNLPHPVELDGLDPRILCIPGADGSDLVRGNIDHEEVEGRDGRPRLASMVCHQLPDRGGAEACVDLDHEGRPAWRRPMSGGLRRRCRLPEVAYRPVDDCLAGRASRGGLRRRARRHSRGGSEDDDKAEQFPHCPPRTFLSYAWTRNATLPVHRFGGAWTLIPA